MKKPSFDDLQGKVCVVTGGAGIIGRGLCEALGSVGASVAVLDLDEALAQSTAKGLQEKCGIKSLGVAGNVLDRESLVRAKQSIVSALGTIRRARQLRRWQFAKATTQAEFVEKDGLGALEKTFYGLDIDGFRKVFDLNFVGTLLPTMVFTTDMLEKGGGVVLNISSMNAFRPLTKIPAYSAAKSAINNFTEWLATHLAKVNIRVNAIAPGFFLTNQNRFLLTNEATGELTPRGHRILAATPMGRLVLPKSSMGPCSFSCARRSRGS